VQNELKKNILLGNVFVFINRRHNQIKLLQWDKDGFALYKKRLEKGTFEQPAIAQNGANILLTNLQLQIIPKHKKQDKKFSKFSQFRLPEPGIHIGFVTIQ